MPGWSLNVHLVEDPLTAAAGSRNQAYLLTGALGKLMVVVEQYPDLKANTTINQLMEELTSTEKANVEGHW